MSAHTFIDLVQAIISFEVAGRCGGSRTSD